MFGGGRVQRGRSGWEGSVAHLESLDLSAPNRAIAICVGHGEVRVYKGTGVSRGVERTTWERSLKKWELQIPCFKAFFSGDRSLWESGTRPFQSPSLSGIRLYFVRPHFPSPNCDSNHKSQITSDFETVRAFSEKLIVLNRCIRNWHCDSNSDLNTGSNRKSRDLKVRFELPETAIWKKFLRFSGKNKKGNN